MSNLKPAPFALTPGRVGRIVNQSTLPAPGIVNVPIEPIVLADEKPRGCGKTARRELLVAAARKLKQRDEAAKRRISLGVPTDKRSPIPKNVAQIRLELLERAIPFLRGQGVLVTIVDRQALIRRYRVTGRQDLLLADDVIALAARLGMRTPEAGE